MIFILILLLILTLTLILTKLKTSIGEFCDGENPELGNSPIRESPDLGILNLGNFQCFVFFVFSGFLFIFHLFFSCYLFLFFYISLFVLLLLYFCLHPITPIILTSRLERPDGQSRSQHASSARRSCKSGVRKRNERPT